MNRQKIAILGISLLLICGWFFIVKKLKLNDIISDYMYSTPLRAMNSSSSSDQIDQSLFNTNTEFAFKLFTQTVQEDKNNNVFISPFSVSINAIYFKGSWTNEFDPNLTQSQSFYLNNGEQINHLAIPKFKLDYEIELNKTLQNLGMTDIFNAKANFKNMTPARVIVDKVKHKTFVEVNEEGTEAAAVTSIGIRATSISQPVNMIVNRPFFYAIQAQKTGTILFMGQILEPRSSYPST